MSRSRLAFGLLFLLAACGASEPSAGDASRAGDASATGSAADAEVSASEITSMLQASAEAWNRGDLDGFLDDYLAGDGTTFSGPTGVTRGIDEIRRRYQTGYWSTGRPEHALSFEELEVRPLGADHALTLGRYVLAERDGGAVASTGFFSLVLTRTDQGWKILHDHSTEAQ